MVRPDDGHFHPQLEDWDSHTVKKLFDIPVPCRDVTYQLSLGGNYYVKYKLFLPRESLVSDIPAGDGNIEKLFNGACTGRELNPGILAGKRAL